MTEELYSKEDLIKINLEYAKLLNEQPVVNRKLVSDILYRVLNLALQLNELYEKRIKEIDARETVTIKEELFKRQEMAELANNREAALEKIFDRNDPDQNDLADLFEDMRKQSTYERTFYESDVELVRKQLDERRAADASVQDLRVEKQNIEEEIATIKNSMVDFETFNAKLNEDYEAFIKENGIDQITEEDTISLVRERADKLEKQLLIDRIKSLAKTATNVTAEDYKYINFISGNEMDLHEINEKLFLYELGLLLKEEAHSYDELLQKTRKIHEFVAEREYASANIYDTTKPNAVSYRTIAFAMDVNNVERQIKSPMRIPELEKRLKEIDAEIENAYDNVKGQKELDDIINNRKPEYQIDEVEPTIIAPIEEDIVEEEPITPIDDIEIEPTVIAPIEETVIKENNVEKGLVPLNEGEYVVTKVEKAKPKLLERIKNLKDKLAKIAAVALSIVILGSVSGILALNSEMAKMKINDAINIEQPVTLNPNVSDGKIDENINQVIENINQTVENIEKQYSVTVGDQVHVSNGVQYYRNSQAAQLGQNSYITGKSGLKEGNYFVNRVALLTKDANGQPTGKIVEVNVTPGISVEEVASSLGLEKDSYDVIMHISTGDKEGNYIEATKGVQSPDDLCWIKTDGTYSNGLSLTTPAEEVLNRSIERGMAR